jgi:4-diphosphocytidyl-2-C-methyl-D-erythritol kinase
MLQQYDVAAFAKINLSLDVVRKREDGYHDLKMVMQSIDLHDDIHLSVTNSKKIEISTNLTFLPNNDSNIAYRAALVFYEKTGIELTGLKITIKKRIPVGAGLGGGSADGAAVLWGLCKLYELEIDTEMLQQWGLLIGADVPFCILGGTALAEGVGEILCSLTPLSDCHILLVKPRFSISTASVFSKLDVKSLRNHPDTEGLIDAIRKRDLRAIAIRLYNVLETVTGKENRVISHIKNKMIDFGAMGAAMSGSGPTVFSVFEDENKALQAYTHFKDRFDETFLCRPLSR